LLQQSEALGLAAHVRFEGFRDDVEPYLHAGSAFVLTSHQEGLPLSILEAMACGLPCVVTDVGGNAEVVADKLNGLVVRPGSSDEVAMAILYLIDHPQERARMSEVAIAKVREQFDIETTMAAIKRVILA
jgi:glycosyltransferase involved in cell wall biosynthesis